jgi:methionine-S-sulfoxide reductase
MKKAMFAAGCFWGVQYYFDQVPGVIKTLVGYSGGFSDNPNWEDVYYEKTGHAETILIEYDPKIISYDKLVRHFFRLHDPTQLNRQGPDVGSSYRSEIFYFDEEQKQIAQEIKNELMPEYKNKIVTLIEPAKKFYLGEDFHQKFTQRTGRGMCHVPYKDI